MTTTAAAIPRVRAPQFRFEDVPKHWFAGSAVATHVANGANLLFPHGERFFVRSVRHYGASSRTTRRSSRRCAPSSGRRGGTRGRTRSSSRVLEAQGYDLSKFLRVYERVAYGAIERVAPPELRLSATVACEHFTAIMAENALTMRMLDHAHPTMRDLLYWHAAEEIEHRTVAFDVLKRVNPSYALRLAGMAVSALLLGSFWAAGTITLLRQDGISLADARRQLRDLRAHGKRDSIGRKVFLRGILEYVRPGFDPRDKPLDHLATEWLASAGLA